VIVIDALDEGYNHNINLLVILAKKISLLPQIFHFLLTSRADEDIERFFHRQDDPYAFQIGRADTTLPCIFGAD
jgi:hypothetical protein